ncbi:MAG: SUMF1/EgtB/PvdO family nonheme iron enzyme [Phaeobacter gallaeciensis]
MKPNAVFATLVFTACACAVLPLHAADPVVANVVSAQRAGTKLVDITFDVSDADSDTLSMSVQISDDSGTTFVVPVTALSGDTSVTSTPTPAAKALVWDASVDFNQQFNATMVVRVIANDGPAPGPPPAGMVLIPAGPFEMGNGATAPEGPVHTVTVSAFYLDQFEVTKALWDDVHAWAVQPANGYIFGNAGSGQGAFHPVHTVNWYDCVKWCNARSQKEGLTPVYYTDAGFTTVFKTGEGTAPFANWAAKGFRLPTEAEWEKAARGTLVGNTYPWGNSITGADANYAGSGDPFEGIFPGTTPVGFYDGDQVPAGANRANNYGLYDMSGNVWEWCWDLYDGSYYGSSPATDPRGPTSASGARVLRGGSWFINTDILRCAARSNDFPVLGDFGIGFRSARGL